MPKTLVIDDNMEFQSLCLQIQSQHDGFDFLFASSDAEAVRILTSVDDLDTAIIAVDRPGISGLDIFKKLSGRRIRIPRIALLSKVNFALIRSSMNRGAADFLTQPVDIDDLSATISRVYRHTEERREAWRNEAQLSAMNREIDIAREIQLRILPGGMPRIDNLDIAVRLLSAKAMSGDFYNAFKIDDERLGILIADVCGKGLPAAFYMAVVSTLLTTVALDGVDSKTCLAQANRLLCRHRIPGMFVSVFYAILNTSTWEIDYANGGHPPPCLVNEKTGQITKLTGGEGVVLGVEESLEYQSKKVQLQPGETVVLFTDGVTEAFNTSREAFGESRLDAVLTESAGKSPEVSVDALLKAVTLFCEDADQSDDITLLAFKRTGGE